MTARLTGLRARSTLLLVVLLCSGHAAGGTAADATVAADAPSAAGHRAWAASASIYAYFVPDDDNYVQPTIAYDRERLHGEMRYNYEDLDTGSLWLGYNFSGGDTLEWAFTPMLGAVVGRTDGVAPGYKASIGWRFLELYSEGEYLIDVHETSDSYFYTWSELALVPADWLRVGLVGQRTRVYESDRDIERGILVGLAFANASFTTYVFDADGGDATIVIAAAIEF